MMPSIVVSPMNRGLIDFFCRKLNLYYPWVQNIFNISFYICKQNNDEPCWW